MKSRPARRAVRAAAAAVAAAIEGLESRRLFAAFLDGPSDRDLIVWGTNGSDAIELRRSGADDVVVSVWTNKDTTTPPTSRQTFDMDDFDRVRVFAFDGDDAVFVYNAASIPNLYVNAGAGDDEVNASVANDTLVGGGGNDTLRGLAGNDRFLADDGDFDTLVGGSGTDTAVVDAGRDAVSGVESQTAAPGFATVDGTTLTVNGTGAADVIEISGDELLGPDRDVLYVALNGVTREFDVTAIDAVRLLGHGGADTIDLGFYQFGASDIPFVVAEGGDGNDVFEVYEGYNTRHALYGGTGDDSAQIPAGSTIVPNLADGGAGTDTVRSGYGLTIDLRTLANVENAATSSGDVIGNALDNRIEISDGTATGGDGNDTLVAVGSSVTLDGGAGDDALTGAYGSDSLVGGSGNDTLTGGNSGDTLRGGEGNDTFIADDGDPDTVDGGSGTDTATLDAGSLDTVTNVETVNGGSGSGQPVVKEPAADATVRGGSYAGQNYGGDATLSVKNSPNSSYDRTAYLRFDLAGVSPDAGRVVLRLHGHVADASNAATVTVRAVADTAWSEGGITAANAPAPGAAIASAVVYAIGAGAAQYFEWDVTEYVRQQRAAGKSAVAFALTSGVDVRVDFASGEAAANRPQLVAQPPAEDPTTVTKSPTEGATVRGGTYANTNYGAAPLLEVKDSPNANYDRVAFVKFDLAGVAGVDRALVRLYGYVSDVDRDVGVGIRAASDAAWDEDTVTWNTAPAVLHQLDVVTVTGFGAGQAAWYTFDVTDYVADAVAAGRGELTFALQAVPGSDVRASFHSGENATNRPELVIES